MDQVGERVLVTLTEVMEQAGAEPVLAVSHGGAMWAFYLKIAAQALDPKVRFGNCAICHYHYEQGHFKLAEVIDPLTGSVCMSVKLLFDYKKKRISTEKDQTQVPFLDMKYSP